MRKLGACLLLAVLWMVAVSPVIAQEVAGGSGPQTVTGDAKSQQKRANKAAKKQARAARKQQNRMRSAQKKAARDYKRKHPSS